MYIMNENNDIMRLIENDERLSAIFRRFSDSTPEEQKKYKIVTYRDTGRIDIFYDGKPATVEKRVLVR